MRLKTMARATPVLVFALLATACDNGFTGLNENPNAPASVTPQYLFPNGITNVVGTIRGGGFDLTFTSLWAQQIAMDRFTDEDRYSMRPGNIDGWWSGFYSGGLEDFATILQQTTPDSEPDLVAPALIMKSWTFGVMTDIWGDIPYSEANQGKGGFTPKYDSQKDIYTGLFTDLTTANGLLTSGGAGDNYGSADVIYNGDMGKWQRFANSLRLRFAMRLQRVDAATAQAQATAALAAGVFTSNADNALLRWPGDGTNDSPIYNTFRTRDDQHMSQTLVDTLKHLYIAINGADTTFDPRLAVYADPVISKLPDTVYVGAPNGLQDDDAIAIGLTNTSRLGAAYRQRTTPSILMTYAEVLFDEAEMAARGWTADDPATLYNAGIRASMQYNGIPDAVTDAYLASPRVAYNPATGLTQIALQKWIALFGEGTEAYSEYRRTGVPDLKAGPAVITNPAIVARRLTYPLSEQSFNNTNLQAAMAAQGDVSLNGHVWWDPIPK
ncbi:MAG TPA: SusD/RagB family nutrient-binding outer membrane lipoprotein [Gemmatimonadaceae bacterium]|nr:SusD/RagB family nutrient-binding outer membrane lipoprotein [Gemmatimonadaceae bacterium]